MSGRKGVAIAIIIGIVIFAAIGSQQEKKANALEQSSVASAAYTPPPKRVVDTATALKMKPLFNIKSDEFSDDKWIKHKSAPQYTNQNGVYVYWNAAGEYPSPLRLRVQYTDDDWLFIKSMIFSIDGKNYTYIPMDVKRDHADGDIWEWSDEVADGTATDIVQAIAGAKSVKIKLNGQQYYDTRTLSAKQIKAIKESLQIYMAMGGELN